MGSVKKIFKRVKRTIKRPISKITKGIARGIAKVAKGVMKGVAVVNKKLGPIGMIAMSIAMPYALGGLSKVVGSAGTMHPLYGMSNPTGLMAKDGFLGAVGKVGNAIRTGYQATTGAISSAMKSITNSISGTFQKFAGNFKGKNNMWNRISKGAKDLFNSAKNTAKKYSPKFRTGQGGTVNVSGWGHPISGQGSTMTSAQAQKLFESGMIDASQLSGQTLASPEGWFTKAGSSGSDNFITDTINNAYKQNMNNWTDGAKTAFNEYKTAARLNGSYINDAELGDIMSKSLTEASNADGFITKDFNFSGSKDFSYSPQHDRYVFNGNDSFKVIDKTGTSQSTLKDKTKNYLKKTVKTKTFDKIKNSLLDQNLEIEAPPINYAMMGGMHTGETMGASNTSGTNITGSTQGNLLHGTFSAQQIDQINNYYRHMNI
jgi:hypothetical protein